MTKERGGTTVEAKDRENGLEIKRKKDSGNQRQRELTKERGGTTVEAKDRENGQR